jgi:hypothetical protein
MIECSLARAWLTPTMKKRTIAGILKHVIWHTLVGVKT